MDDLTYDNLTYGDPTKAFDDAIKARRLSASPSSPLYAGLFMYMGTKDGLDLFKHKMTRRYLGALSTVGA